MKKTLCILIALFSLCTLRAQEYLHLYDGGHVVFEKAISNIDSIFFQNGNSIFSCVDDLRTFAIHNVDSITFSSDTLMGGRDIYIIYNGSNVTVVNPLASAGVAITTSGADVTVVSTAGIQDVVYHLSGSTTEGSLTITPDKRLTLSLEGVSITNSDGPAIEVLVDKAVTVILANGSENYLNDGAGSTKKAALQSKSQLTFDGTGTLTVNGNKRNGIHSDDFVRMNSGNIVVASAVADGIHCDWFVMNNGTLQITASGDGIDGDEGYVEINGGSITVNVATADSKGIKCDSTVTVNGGTLHITASGDQSKALKSGRNMYIHGGEIVINATGTYVSETTTDGVDLSYCTGIKVGGDLFVTGGTTTVTCPSSNAGGKAVSSAGNITITDGVLNLTATGACNKYLVTGSTYDSYSSVCLKSNSDITISGGTITATAGGRAISCDGNYTQSGGTITASTSAAGFTTMGSGTSCTDGFAAACLNVDGDIEFVAGHFHGTSTGRGGRGIKCDGTLTVGTVGAADSLTSIYVTTSGAPVNVSSGGGGWPGGGGSSSDYWKGLPKGVKVEGNLTVNSGHLQSYCSQTSGSTTGEAIETKANLYINGGFVEANAYDDAINANNYIQITGGNVWAYARGNDGMDCNGTRIDVSGGTVIIRGTEVAIDDNGDHGGRLYVTGGTIILVGGNMGTTEATPSLTGQKGVTLSSGGGGGWPGGGGGGGSTLATNGFCLKNSSGTNIITFKWPNVSGSGFYNTPMPALDVMEGDGLKSVTVNSGVYVTTPAIQSGTYTYFTSPTISGGTNWHGLYTGATVNTSGNGTNVTAQ